MIASLLTLSSVTKRIREFGTLKALGWSQWLVVRQVTGESLFQGLLGGAVGVCLGLVGAAAIAAFSPSLSATVSSAAEQAGGFLGGPGGGGRDPSARATLKRRRLRSRSALPSARRSFWPRSASPSSADSWQERSEASVPLACALPTRFDTSTEVMTTMSENRNESAPELRAGSDVRASRRLEELRARGRPRACGQGPRANNRVGRRGRDRRAERFREDDAPPAPRRPRPPVSRKRPLRGPGHGCDG